MAGSIGSHDGRTIPAIQSTPGTGGWFFRRGPIPASLVKLAIVGRCSASSSPQVLQSRSHLLPVVDRRNAYNDWQPLTRSTPGGPAPANAVAAAKEAATDAGGLKGAAARGGSPPGRHQAAPAKADAGRPCRRGLRTMSERRPSFRRVAGPRSARRRSGAKAPPRRPNRSKIAASLAKKAAPGEGSRQARPGRQEGDCEEAP